jgi:hypothetical protein
MLSVGVKTLSGLIGDVKMILGHKHRELMADARIDGAALITDVGSAAPKGEGLVGLDAVNPLAQPRWLGRPE